MRSAERVWGHRDWTLIPGKRFRWCEPCKLLSPSVFQGHVVTDPRVPLRWWFANFPSSIKSRLSCHEFLRFSSEYRMCRYGLLSWWGGGESKKGNRYLCSSTICAGYRFWNVFRIFFSIMGYVGFHSNNLINIRTGAKKSTEQLYDYFCYFP